MTKIYLDNMNGYITYPIFDSNEKAVVGVSDVAYDCLHDFVKKNGLKAPNAVKLFDCMNTVTDIEGVTAAFIVGQEEYLTIVEIVRGELETQNLSIVFSDICQLVCGSICVEAPKKMYNIPLFEDHLFMLNNDIYKLHWLRKEKDLRKVIYDVYEIAKEKYGDKFEFLRSGISDTKALRALESNVRSISNPTNQLDLEFAVVCNLEEAGKLPNEEVTK